MSFKTINTPEDIYKTVSGYQQSRVILSAFQLELFSAIAGDGSTSAQVAQSLALDPKATDRLMNALVALGLLEKKVGIFHNTQLSSQFLRKESPDYMAGLGHSMRLWEAWSTLSDAVRKGGNVRDKHWTRERRDSFIAAMHNRATKVSPEVVSKLDLSGVSRVLDVGGGSGAFAMQFVRAGQGVSATVFDTPEVIPLTRQYVAEAGLGGRVDFREGDYNVDELGRDYDLVFMSSIVHINSYEQNQELIAKGARALRENGRLVVRDFIVNSERTGPIWAVMFALNMLVNTDGGDTYSEDEVFAWFRAAGLGGFQVIETEQDSGLLIARKT